MPDTMPELIPVNIVIADRSYRLKIEPADEEMVRKSASLINDKVAEFKNQFAGKDMQDYIAMVLIWFVTEQKEAGSKPVQWNDTVQKLSELSKMIDKVLAENPQ
ncbi:MAG TPA: cell division protein ZapA [Sediminibacterium sp.]|nr:cell division protein ZapA [Sediminibacterium sp.]